MLVEIFLGSNSSINTDIRIDKIEENKDLIKLYYQTSKEGDNEDGESTTSQDGTATPFLIAFMPKSRKPTKFFENGEEVKMERRNLYIDN